MERLPRRAALLGLFALCLACSDQARPTAPSPPLTATPRPAPGPAPAPLPPATGPSTTYRFSAPLDDSSGVSVFTEASSFVLYENGHFYLRYDAFPNALHGSYEQGAGSITFHFGAQTSTADANGTLRGDLLEVRYSLLMQHSDFEGGVYRRVP